MPLRPPQRKGAYWRLLSHLNLNHLSLADEAEGRQALQEILRLYDFSEAGRGDLTVPKAKFNHTMRIDTRLSTPLKTLPGFPSDEDNLAFRNLTRAKMVTLATGQQGDLFRQLLPFSGSLFSVRLVDRGDHAWLVGGFVPQSALIAMPR